MAPNPHFLCPNPKCDYRGPAKRRPRGSRITLWILFALGVSGTFTSLGFGAAYLLGWAPFVIYLFAAFGYEYRCPHCGYYLGRSQW